MDISINGEKYILDQSSDGRSEFTYKLYNAPFSSGKEFFQLTIRDEGDLCRIIEINNHGQDKYKHKGIAEWLVKEIMNKRQQPMESSNNKKDGHGVYRTELADSMWRGFMENHPSEITYDADRDIYRWDKALPCKDDLNRRTGNLKAFSGLAKAIHETLELDGSPEDLTVQMEERFEKSFQNYKKEK